MDRADELHLDVLASGEAKLLTAAAVPAVGQLLDALDDVDGDDEDAAQPASEQFRFPAFAPWLATRPRILPPPPPPVPAPRGVRTTRPDAVAVPAVPAAPVPAALPAREVAASDAPRLVPGQSVQLPIDAASALVRVSVLGGAPDLVLLVLGHHGRVGSDGDMVFWGQPRHPSGGIVLTPAGADVRVGQLQNLGVARVAVVVSADQVLPAGLRLRVDGGPPCDVDVPAGQPAAVVAELVLLPQAVLLNVVGEARADGLDGLARVLGVDVT